jgi:hypothetical protein
MSAISERAFLSVSVISKSTRDRVAAALAIAMDDPMIPMISAMSVTAYRSFNELVSEGGDAIELMSAWVLAQPLMVYRWGAFSLVRLQYAMQL